jgi:hypothetical protein
VRGVVYEAAGTVAPDLLDRGRAIVEAAGERWRIPVAVIDADPAGIDSWVDAMTAAAEHLTRPARPL